MNLLSLKESSSLFPYLDVSCKDCFDSYVLFSFNKLTLTLSFLVWPIFVGIHTPLLINI